MIGSGGNVVDNKIVSLEFQNQNFETNAKTSLSTLERLKKALSFKGVSAKVFDGIGTGMGVATTGAKNLGSAIGNVNTALDAIKDVTAFTMINKAATDAYESVKRLVKSLTVDQVSSGWEKYANKTEKIQTIMAATAMNYDDQEKQLEDVTAQIDKLNWFTDETSYKFVEMADNIGKFTSNQVELGTAVTAMQGISTWASKSGASVEEAGRAMYNLSQAIAVGSVKLQDWKSIENANMATAEFKQTAIETAEALGVLTKVSDGVWKNAAGNEVTVKNFNENLKDEWFTSEVLLKTLDKYGGFSDAMQQWMEKTDYEVSTKDMLEYIEKYQAGTLDIAKTAREAGISVADLEEGLKTLADESMNFGREAFKAAQQTLTFEQAIDYVKESVSTGWMNTFEIIFGDYLGAKGLWSDLSEYLYEIFVKGGEERNDLLKEAFETTQTATKEDWAKIEKSGLASPGYIRNLRRNAEEAGEIRDLMLSDQEWLNEKLEEGALTVSDLENGFTNLGHSESEIGEINEDVKATLDQALQDRPEEIQAILDKLDGHDLSDLNQIIFGDGSYAEGQEDLEATLDTLLSTLGLTQDAGEDVKTILRDMGYFSDDTTKSITEMSREELRQLGYSGQQIKRIRELAKEGKTAGEILEDLGINTKSGTDHWVDGLHNVMESIVGVKELLGDTFSNYFDGIESSQIYDLLSAFDEATEKFKHFIGAGEDEEANETLVKVLDAIASAADFLVGNLSVLAKALAFKGAGIAIHKIGTLLGMIKKLALPVLAAAAAFEFIKGLISGLGIDWGDFAGKVADLSKRFTEWLKVVDPLGKALDLVGKAGQAVGKRIRGFFDAFSRMEKVNRGVRQLQRGFKLFVEGFGEHMKELPGRFDNFTKKVDELGGVKPENLSEIFSLARDEIGDFLMTFPGVRNFINGFKLLISAVEDRLTAMGVPVDKIKASIKGLIDIVGTALEIIGAAARGSFNKVTELWGKFKELPVVKDAVEKFGNAFKTVQSTIGPFFEGFGKQWDNFKQRVGNLEGGFSLGNVGKIFDIFKEEIIGYITNWDGFKAIQDAFSSFWENIKKSLSENETFMSVYNGFKDIVNGLIDVFDDVKLPESLDDLPEFFSSIADAIHNMPEAGEGSGIKGAIWNGIKFVLEKLLDIVSYVTSHWKTFLKIAIVLLLLKKVDTIVSDIRKHYEAINKELKARAFMETAIGVMALAAAIWIVAMTFKDLAQTFATDAEHGWLEKIAPGLAGIVVILGMMAVLFGVVGKMEVKPGTAWGVAAAVAAVWIVAHALMDITKELSGNFLENMAKIGPAIIAIIVIIGMLAGLFAVVGKMKVENGTAWGIAAAMAAVWVVAHALIDIVNDLGLGTSFEDNMAKIGPAILAIIVVVGMLTVLFAVVGKMNPGTGTVWGIAATMAAFWVIAEAFKDIAGIERDDLERAELALVAVTGCLAALMLVASFSKIDPKMMFSIAAVLATMGIVLAGIAYVADVNPEGLEKAMDALFHMMLGLALIVAAAGALKPSIGVMILLALIIALIAGIVVALNHFVGVDDTVAIAESMTKLFAGIAILMAAIAIVGTLGLPAVGAGLLALVGIFVVLGLVFTAVGALISAFPQIEGWIDGGIRIFEKVIDAICYAIQHVIEAILGAIIGDRTPLQMLADDVAYMAEVFGGEDFKNNIEAIGTIDMSGNVMKNLGELALVSIVGLVIGVINGLATALLNSLGVEESPIQSLVNDLTYLATNLGDPAFKSNIEAIGRIEIGEDVAANLGKLALVAVIGDVIGFINGVATAMLNFLGVGDSPIGTLVSDLTYLATNLGDPTFKSNIEAIGKIEIDEDVAANLTSLALIEVIGGVIGFVNGIATAVLGYTGVGEDSPIVSLVNDLTYLAENLGGDTFKENIEAIGNIKLDEGALSNLTNFAALDICLALSGFVSGITSIASEVSTGKTSVESLVADLTLVASSFADPTFQENLASIANITLDEGVSENLKEFAKLEAIMALAGLVEGIASIGTQLTEGNSAVQQVAIDIQDIADAFSDETFQANLESIAGLTIPTDQISSLVEALGEVTMQGFINSVLDFFNMDDETNLEQFKKDASDLGQAMVIWSSCMKVIDGLGGFEVPEEEIAALQRSLNNISGEGGLFGAIGDFLKGSNEENLEQFKTDVGSLGEALKTFVTSLGDETDTTKLHTASRAIASLAGISSSVAIISQNTEWATTFSEVLGIIGGSIKSNLIDLLGDDLETVEDCSEKIGALLLALGKLAEAKFEGAIMNDGTVSTFSDNLETILTKLTGLNDEDFSGADRFVGAVNSVASADIEGFIEKTSGSSGDAGSETGDKAGDQATSSMASSIEKGASSVASAVGTVMTDAFSGTDKIGFTAGFDLVTQVANGIRGNSSVDEAVSALFNNASSAASGSYSSFYDAGASMGSGFKEGIISQILYVKAAAEAIAMEAVRRAKEVIKSASPSKVMIEVGGFFGEGFALGILSQSNYVGNSAESLGRTAINGMSKAIEYMNDAIATDLDVQPTIRPVLDLSEIQNGATSVSDMLNNVEPISVYGNLTAINGIVSQRKQGASLDDVVMALGNVERTTSNIRSGDTYNVNGVTYDDGTNISDAVKVLAHAVLMDRRR